MILQDSVETIKGVGPALASKLKHIGIVSIEQLIDYYPRRYEDFSQLTRIADITPGPVTIQAVIERASGRYVRRGMHITEAVARDASDSVRLIWFNQPYRAQSIRAGEAYFISGNFELGSGRLSIQNPSTELVSDVPINAARILPVYKETKGLSSRQLRVIIANLQDTIADLPETLPSWLVEAEELISHAEAVYAIHFPRNQDDLTHARRRLGFEEVFALTLTALRTKYELQTEQAPSVPFEASVAQNFVKHLPFDLTGAQRRVCWQIFQDLERTQPMNRLVEGDVGAGKTVVAALAAAMVLHSGHQVALMAPTELLARQHAATLHRLLNPLGYADQVGLLVGSLKPADKQRAREHIASGDIRFIIGTHALIQESVDISGLELVIIDEQHRFGVEQRKKLQIKAGHMPHVLSMTATPIPRSLALTLYGELEISILDAKPAGRREIITTIESPNSRKQLYSVIDDQLTQGRQMFVVCPLITDSTALDAASAEQVYETFRTKDFKHRHVGLLHGKMRPQEKNTIMQQFVDHELDILVSTTVIEVGVDVPNASIMLIEAAERFGLAQIHQLRGRVGRGGYQGYCYLMMSDSKAPSRRLRALESSSDGFKLAELDLEIRGPGAVYGTMQHGQLDLRIASLSDTKLISSARQAAQTFIDRREDLLQYPQLATRVQRLSAVTNLN